MGLSIKNAKPFLCLYCFSHVQHTAGQLRNRKSGSSGGTKVAEQGESITFADVAGVDEAKEELEEIVVCASVSGWNFQCQNNEINGFVFA